MFFFFLKKLFFKHKERKKSIKTELESKELFLSFFYYTLIILSSKNPLFKISIFFFNYLLHLKNISINSNQVLFFINLKTEQIKLTILNFELVVINNFSNGFILKLLNIKKKSFRRLEKSFYFFFFFFKKYLNNFLSFNIHIFFFFYKFKFFNFFQSFLLNLSFDNVIFYFLPSNRLNRYEFRRVSAIKKRIRKKLK